MKKLMFIFSLLLVTVVAQAQFEKGKWFVNPSVTGLDLSYNTQTEKAHFGIEVNGGAFLVDNVALLLHVGANWGEKERMYNTDWYNIGVGGRYYFDAIGVFLGANVNLNHHVWEHDKRTLVGFGTEAGYAFFLSKTVTIEPAVYWDINKDRSEFGLKVGFGFYF